jgi:hypothetical protein
MGDCIAQQTDSGGGNCSRGDWMFADFLAGFFRQRLGLCLDLFGKVGSRPDKDRGGLGHRIARIGAEMPAHPAKAANDIIIALGKIGRHPPGDYIRH